MADQYIQFPVSGGSGSGANATLSNLTNPTAINQNLLFNPDASLTIGAAAGVSRPLSVYASAIVSAGTYPNAATKTNVTMVGNTAFPSINFYDGGSDAFTLGFNVTGLAIRNVGTASALFQSNNTGFSFADNATNTIYFSGNTSNVILPNTHGYAARNAGNTADVVMLSLDAFNRTNFSSGSGQNILLNANMISSAADTTSLGVVGDAFTNIVSNAITLGSGGGDYGSLSVAGTDPNSGLGTNSGIYIKTDDATKNIFIFTLNGTATKDVWIETGNASAGASGNIVLQPGSATGAVGKIKIINDLTALLVPTTVTAIGTTGAQTINKMSGTVNIAAAGTSVVVTNSLVTVNSIVLCVVRTNDSTAVLKNCVPAAGSFTITLTGTATAATSIGFFVINQ